MLFLVFCESRNRYNKNEEENKKESHITLYFEYE